MKIITATLLLVISLLGILGTAFLYLGELTQGKGGGYLYFLLNFLKVFFLNLKEAQLNKKLKGSN